MGQNEPMVLWNAKQRPWYILHYMVKRLTIECDAVMRWGNSLQKFISKHWRHLFIDDVWRRRKGSAFTIAHWLTQITPNCQLRTSCASELDGSGMSIYSHKKWSSNNSIRRAWNIKIELYDRLKDVEQKWHVTVLVLTFSLAMRFICRLGCEKWATAPQERIYPLETAKIRFQRHWNVCLRRMENRKCSFPRTGFKVYLLCRAFSLIQEQILVVSENCLSWNEDSKQVRTRVIT